MKKSTPHEVVRPSSVPQISADQQYPPFASKKALLDQLAEFGRPEIMEIVKRIERSDVHLWSDGPRSAHPRF